MERQSWSVRRTVRIGLDFVPGERDAGRGKSGQSRQRCRIAERVVASVLDDGAILAWISVAIFFVGTRSGVRLIVIPFAVTGGGAGAVFAWVAGVRQDARQAERWRDMKRPGGDNEIEHAQNHAEFLSAATPRVNSFK